MVLLRESSKEIDLEVELSATVGGNGAQRIPQGEVLAAYAEAVCQDKDVDAARTALREVLSDQAFYLAAAIVGIFNGLVRVADFSGIPLDDSTLQASVQEREALGLNAFAGAANSDL